MSTESDPGSTDSDHCGMTPKTSTPEALDRLETANLASAQVMSLEAEVRKLEQHSRNVLGAGFAAASLALAFAAQLSLEVGFILLTLLWGLAIAWQFNLAAEAAAVAEARDKLARSVNEALAFPTFSKEVIGNVGRQANGTTLAALLIAVVFVGSQAAAFVNIFMPFDFVTSSAAKVGHIPWFVSLPLQVGSTGLALVAGLGAWVEVYRYRYQARLDLGHRTDEVPSKTRFFTLDRPSTIGKRNAEPDTSRAEPSEPAPIVKQASQRTG